MLCQWKEQLAMRNDVIPYRHHHDQGRFSHFKEEEEEEEYSQLVAVSADGC